MSIAVTGATGPLGRLIISSLLDRGVPADQITAVGRNIDRLAELAGRGVATQRADYDDPGSLQAAFAGAEKLMFVSGSEVGKRVVQHGNVVTAAKEAGVRLIVYTSIAHADTSSLVLAAEHKATEQLITDAGLPYVFLRNSWYLENYTGQLPTYLRHGVTGAAGDGRVSAATRADYAEAAAVVLTAEGQAGRVYELGGAPVTMTELAAEISRQAGRTVSYLDLPVDKYTELLVTAGLPEGYAAMLADGDRGLAQGELEVGDDLTTLLGRTPTTLAEAIRAAL
ncbi:MULTISPECIES: SDR family oxidoreductase [Micromonospora]|uniref:SDR family oxidoreductase n=1 Tax=Micromonospora solifontis TaxID=2487138 RepID=A0ABX9WHY6_9ACTN|nr:MULTISPECIES: SDR family oxidoreductase [Micromonospora]NES16567.1 SDR family oxidoreductase [Micromonospora sp. PPF5-17B]NES37607.1 SDR family oxidoreductase [Micromonospora solifontis]NES58509.1 SDR family oxidoreductase [Micromonospora sp. PPF5-6]RNL98141.1 SDR family oxidoreductase [Micromonospora solifontis]